MSHYLPSILTNVTTERKRCITFIIQNQSPRLFQACTHKHMMDYTCIFMSAISHLFHHIGHRSSNVNIITFIFHFLGCVWKVKVVKVVVKIPSNILFTTNMFTSFSETATLEQNLWLSAVLNKQIKRHGEQSHVFEALFQCFFSTSSCECQDDWQERWHENSRHNEIRIFHYNIFFCGSWLSVRGSKWLLKEENELLYLLLH